MNKGKFKSSKCSVYLLAALKKTGISVLINFVVYSPSNYIMGLYSNALWLFLYMYVIHVACIAMLLALFHQHERSYYSI